MVACPPRSYTLVTIHSNLEPGQTWGLACVAIDGVESSALAAHLWDRCRIIVPVVGREAPSDPLLSYRGLRITPNLR